jgi:hypothetical protein
VRALAEADEPGGLTAVVQLHLSRDCNTPELAAEAGRAVLREVGSNATLVTASQYQPAASIPLVARGDRKRGRGPISKPRRSVQLGLPGME